MKETLIKFARLEEKHLEMVMGWRVKPDITRYMFTDVEYDLDKQRRWFHKISGDDTYRYWIIYFRDIPIGLVNLAAIDRVNRRCTAGYYIGELEYRSLGALIPPFLYNYVFHVMEFRKIYGEVIAGNENILKLHALHGFRQVGVYRDHVFRDRRFHDVVLIELLAESWLAQKRYQRDLAHFE